MRSDNIEPRRLNESENAKKYIHINESLYTKKQKKKQLNKNDFRLWRRFAASS